ncbi:hypothetical protein [Phreatobacter sp.]|uniref:hypothetical protein n=1 Tax=Phreatobacter sp. TaxID=1966341 RepID=UPI0025CC77F7|nr:hypothetical protein [Phreatobacter sp.]
MVSTTGPSTAGIDTSRRADDFRRAEEARRAEETRRAEEVRQAEETARSEGRGAAGSSASGRTEAPAVVFDSRIAEMRRAEQASERQPTRSANAAAVAPSARLFDITV